MGSAKAKGAGAGAVSGAAAGSAFGPYGAAIGGVAGGAYGYFSSEEVPEYQQPALDPRFKALQEQNKQQNIDAINARIRGDETSLTARYGTLTSGDTASVMARYGALLSLAQSGNLAGSDPLKRVA